MIRDGRAIIPIQDDIMRFDLENIRLWYFFRNMNIRGVGDIRSKRLERLVMECTHQAKLEGKSKCEPALLAFEKTEELGTQIAKWNPANAITFKT